MSKCPHGMVMAFPRASDPRDQGGSLSALCDLSAKVPHHIYWGSRAQIPAGEDHRALRREGRRRWAGRFIQGAPSVPLVFSNKVLAFAVS